MSSTTSQKPHSTTRQQTSPSSNVSSDSATRREFLLKIAEIQRKMRRRPR